MKRTPQILLGALLLGLTACKPPVNEAESLLKAGRYPQAETVLRQLIQEGSEDAKALLAQALFHTEGPEAAIEQLRGLHTKQQDQPVYRQVVASIEQEYAALDQLARGGTVSEFEAYLADDHPEALLDRARWLRARHEGKGYAKLDQSKDPMVQQVAKWRLAGQTPERLRQLLKQYPDSRLRAAWYQSLVNTAWKAKQRPEALALLQQWERELPERHPRRAALLLQRADFYLENQQPAQALQDYRDFLRLFPKHPDGRVALYKARDKLRPYLSTTDHRFLAEQAYERWMYQTAYAELSQVPSRSAGDRLRLGEYALEAKLLAPAKSHFENLQKDYRGSREAGLASVGLASIQRSSKAYGEAIRRLQEIKVAYASQPEVLAAALWEEGLIHDFQNRDDLRAAAYHRLVAADPGFKEAMTALWYAIWYDYRQGEYQRVVDLIAKHARYFAKHELESRFLYWQARAYEGLGDRDAAQKIYLELREYPMIDYYSHRAKERLRVIEEGGEDRYAISPYQGVTRERIPDPGYAQAFRQALTGDKEAFSEVMELYYLGQDADFMHLAAEEADSRYQVLHGLQLQKQQRYYESVTRYRYLAETDDRYLPAAFPLAFFDKIEAEARKNGLNPFLPAGLIWQESQYKPDIQSWVGATGLMQIMPATGAGIAQNLGIKDFRLTDADTNIRMGVWYLKSRHDVFDGNPMLAVASYNAGAGPVMRWKRESGHLPYDAQAESITYPETRNYVKRVFTSYWIYQALYGKGR